MAGRPGCPNSLCLIERTRTDTPICAHLCEHGVPCRYQQDESGRVIDWDYSCCSKCNERLAAEGRAA